MNRYKYIDNISMIRMEFYPGQKFKHIKLDEDIITLSERKVWAKTKKYVYFGPLKDNGFFWTLAEGGFEFEERLRDSYEPI